MAKVDKDKEEYLVYLNRIEPRVRLGRATIPFLPPRRDLTKWCEEQLDTRGLSLTAGDKYGTRYIVIKSDRYARNS